MVTKIDIKVCSKNLKKLLSHLWKGHDWDEFGNKEAYKYVLGIVLDYFKGLREDPGLSEDAKRRNAKIKEMFTFSKKSKSTIEPSTIIEYGVDIFDTLNKDLKNDTMLDAMAIAANVAVPRLLTQNKESLIAQIKNIEQIKNFVNKLEFDFEVDEIKSNTLANNELEISGILKLTELTFSDEYIKRKIDESRSECKKDKSKLGKIWNTAKSFVEWFGGEILKSGAELATDTANKAVVITQYATAFECISKCISKFINSQLNGYLNTYYEIEKDMFEIKVAVSDQQIQETLTKNYMPANI